jgi:hypothetical protein
MRFLIVAVLLTALPFAARAETVRVDRVDIVDRGIYAVTTGGETPDAGTPTGKISAVSAVKLSEATTTIPGRRGTEFGFQYTIVGEPAGAEVSIDVVNSYPSPGLLDPGEKKPVLESRYSRKKKIGETAYLGYGFENDWEIVPGTWTFVISYEGRELARQSFTVAK